MVSRFLTTIPSFHFALIGNLVDIDCLISITAPVYAQATKISTLNIGSTCRNQHQNRCIKYFFEVDLNTQHMTECLGSLAYLPPRFFAGFKYNRFVLKTNISFNVTPKQLNISPHNMSHKLFKCLSQSSSSKHNLLSLESHMLSRKEIKCLSTRFDANIPNYFEKRNENAAAKSVVLSPNSAATNRYAKLKWNCR